MDLHNRAKLAGCYATYIEGKSGDNIASELDTAIHTHRTWVSKGALLLTEVLPETNELLLTFTDAHKTGFAVPKTAQVVLKGKDKTFTTSVSLDKPVRVSLNQLSGTDPIIPLLYEAPGINGAATVSNAAHVAASTSDISPLIAQVCIVSAVMYLSHRLFAGAVNYEFRSRILL